MATIPSYFEGLLSEDDMSSLRNQSLASGLLSAGQAYSRAGAPSLMPQGNPFSDALSGFNQGYQGTLDSALNNMLRATQVQELVRKQKQAQQLNQLYAKKVFDTIKIIDLEEMSLDDKIIDSLMFSKCKYDANGVFTKWKSRLAARGDQQDASAYGGETSSPTANMTTINLILNFAVQNKYEIFTSDVPGAYLHADLEELVIMRLPRSCTKFWLEIIKIPEDKWNEYVKDGYVYVKLCKALYGLIQSSMLWFNNISDTLINMGFVAANNDPCSFRKDFAIGTLHYWFTC